MDQARDQQGAMDHIEEAFEAYLKKERGLSPPTVKGYMAEVSLFLSTRYRRWPGLKSIRPRDVARFITKRAELLAPVSIKSTTTALRAFFRFLFMRGDITVDLARAVPPVAHWRLSALPKFIPAAQVNRIVSSCDRRTAIGRRDYAILLMLARLGLRAGEIVAMLLDDIDWDAAEIVIRGKGPRHDRLPLPSDVGRALASYLRRGRPQCPAREVFLTISAPPRGLRSSMVGGVVQRAVVRAGLNPPQRGSHLLRHSLATDLLRRGASLTEIGELLRHRHVDTTAIYAKVDINALKALVLRWPEVHR